MKYIKLVFYSVSLFNIINFNAAAKAAKVAKTITDKALFLTKKLGSDTIKEKMKADEREAQFHKTIGSSSPTKAIFLDKSTINNNNGLNIDLSEMQTMISNAVNNSFTRLQSSVNFIDKKSEKKLNEENIQKVKEEFIKNTLHSITGFINIQKPLERKEEANADKDISNKGKSLFENNRDLVSVF